LQCPRTLRAVELRAFGGPEGLVLTELPDPQPGRGEVRVDLVAAALNRREWWIRTGGKAALPAVLGSDGAGIVSAVGPDVEGVSVEDEVVIYPGVGWGDDENAAADGFVLVGVPGQGTYAEQIVVHADQVRPRPSGWSWLEAAALPVAGLTAWRALVRCAGAGPGKSVLVTGAGGGVATFGVQIGAALGASMLVTTSSSEKLERARALGAQGGFDYRDPSWPDCIRPVDAVLDSVGGDVWPGALASLREGGVLVTFGDTGGELGCVPIADVFFRYLRIQGTTLGSPREFDALLAHCAEAPWRPVIDSVFPLADAAKAHERLDAPDRFGKVLLAIDRPRAGRR
jgi:zinc-binding alcohol dehydrogenase/oxidoreductase